jgi:hypothetical protein
VGGRASNGREEDEEEFERLDEEREVRMKRGDTQSVGQDEGRRKIKGLGKRRVRGRTIRPREEPTSK